MLCILTGFQQPLSSGQSFSLSVFVPKAAADSDQTEGLHGDVDMCLQSRSDHFKKASPDAENNLTVVCQLTIDKP